LEDLTMYLWILAHPYQADVLKAARREQGEAIAAYSYRAIEATIGGATWLATTVARLAQRAVAELVAGYKRRQAIAELSALSDRTLKDIGIDRSEIRSVAADLAAGAQPARVGEGASATLRPRERVHEHLRRALERANDNAEAPRRAA